MYSSYRQLHLGLVTAERYNPDSARTLIQNSELNILNSSKYLV
jgi:hypothetical protein